MSEVKVINKIEVKVNEYINQYGSSKTWLAKQMGYNSRQAFDGAINSDNPTIGTLAKFAKFLKCNIDELYELVYTEEL